MKKSKSAKPRTINESGLQIIKESESCVLGAYEDTGNVWTIGYGHTGPDVYDGLKITKEDAERLLKEDLNEVYQSIQTLLPIKLTDNQYSALCSFIFNIGHGQFKESTMRRKLLMGDILGAANEFDRWNKDNGKVYAGLVERRAREKSLFLKA